MPRTPGPDKLRLNLQLPAETWTHLEALRAFMDAASMAEVLRTTSGDFCRLLDKQQYPLIRELLEAEKAEQRPQGELRRLNESMIPKARENWQRAREFLGAGSETETIARVLRVFHKMLPLQKKPGPLLELPANERTILVLNVWPC